MFGQERSREYAALAAEPDCASDSSWTELLPAFERSDRVSGSYNHREAVATANVI